MRSSISGTLLATMTGDVAGTATQKQRPKRLIFAMRDDKFRPIIRTLADALDQMEKASLKPIGNLRGGAGRLTYWGGCAGALTWIDGEAANGLVRVAIPVSRWFFGWDDNNRFHERPITLFNGTTILEDGSLRLEQNLWIRRVAFDIPPLAFMLTDVQKRIATLVSEYLNLLGHDLPTDYIDYARLGLVEVTSLKPVVDYVRSHWQHEGLTTPPPSRETIATTLEALFMRRRARPQH